jgi:hypothetical protein
MNASSAIARVTGTRFVLAVFLLSACGPRPATRPSPAPAAWLDRLYLGRNIDGRPGVSDAAWERFLHEVVVPRFPDGFTVLTAEGRWRGADTTEAERSLVLEVVHAGDSTANARVLEIAGEYRSRFRQQAVLRVRVPAEPTLLH